MASNFVFIAFCEVDIYKKNGQSEFVGMFKIHDIHLTC
jgi:hypothetical protein